MVFNYTVSCISTKNYRFYSQHLVSIIVYSPEYFETKVHSKSSRRPQTSANAMLIARWQHHIRFGSGFPYAPLKAMLTKISKWSRIQDSFRIAPKIESRVVFAIPDIPWKFQKNHSITFWVILLTHRQTNKLWQKHNLLGGGKNVKKAFQAWCCSAEAPCIKLVGAYMCNF